MAAVTAEPQVCEHRGSHKCVMCRTEVEWWDTPTFTGDYPACPDIADCVARWLADVYYTAHPNFRPAPAEVTTGPSGEAPAAPEGEEAASDEAPAAG